MAHLTVRTPFGLGLLKAACLLFCLFSWLGLIPSSYSGEASRSGAIVSPGISWHVSLPNLSLICSGILRTAAQIGDRLEVGIDSSSRVFF
jgi:hypothetical protein